MIRTQISIIDNVTPDLRKKIQELENTRPLMRAVGQSMRDVMREHYASLPPNRRGFPSQSFWKKHGRDKVSIASFDDQHARVVVDSVEMGHRFFGGTVRPKKGRALSIPLSPEAYKTGSASLWSGNKLTLIERQGKPPLLVDTTNPKVWRIHYVLVPSITHRPDDRAFPPRNLVSSAIRKTLQEKINVIWRASR